MIEQGWEMVENDRARGVAGQLLQSLQILVVIGAISRYYLQRDNAVGVVIASKPDR